VAGKKSTVFGYALNVFALRSEEVILTLRKGTCVHFNGIQHRACHAGVVYDKIDRKTGRDLPCLDRSDRPGDYAQCALYEPISEEDIRKDREELDSILADMDAGISSCCKAPLILQEHKRSVRAYCSKCKKLAWHGHR
jgi:hypothetical protein